MNFLRRKKTIIVSIACLFLVLVTIYQQYSNKQDMLSLLQQAEPETVEYKKIRGSYETYELMNAEGEFLSYAVISSSSGYGGPLTTLTSVNKEGKISNVVLLSHAETPSYLNRVLGEGYPDNLHGKTITERLLEQDGVDAISGATRTSEGIIAAVEKGMVQIGENQLALAVPVMDSFHFQWQDGAIVLLLVLALVALKAKKKKLRPWLLAASVIVIGFMTHSSITVGNYTSILANKIPVIAERPIWFIMVVGFLVVTMFIGKNLYCGWVCPFGAVQEGIYKALSLKTIRVEQRILDLAKKSRWIFIWVACLLALLYNNPGIATYEPFSVFFGGEGTTAQWLIMGIVILMSIFILRFWCRFFCPVGAILDAVALCKRKVKKLFTKQQVITPHHFTGNECSSCDSCKSACGGKGNAVPLNPSNKFVVGVILLTNLLIIVVLLHNINLF